jgi:hypothetical protein
MCRIRSKQIRAHRIIYEIDGGPWREAVNSNCWRAKPHTSVPRAPKEGSVSEGRHSLMRMARAAWIASWPRSAWKKCWLREVHGLAERSAAIDSRIAELGVRVADANQRLKRL